LTELTLLTFRTEQSHVQMPQNGLGDMPHVGKGLAITADVQQPIEFNYVCKIVAASETFSGNYRHRIPQVL